jgi:chromosome partitioning protein
MWRIMQATYAGLLLGQPILASEEIKNATQAFRSIYESKPSASHQTYMRCRDNLDAVFGEVEQQIRQQWASTSLTGAADAGVSVAA